MSGVVYIDGQYTSHADAKINVFDHGLLYGDGVFEGIRVYNGKVFKLKSHLIRLYQSARFIDLQIRESLQEIDAIVRETVRRSELPDSYIRLVVTRGVGPLGVNPKQCTNPSLIVIIDKLAVYPEEKYQTGITLMTSSVRQKNAATFSTRAKTLNYLPNMMAKLEALRSGADEALLLNDQGFVSECVAENVFTVSHTFNGEMRVMTPDVSCGILEGVTRNTVIQLAHENGIEIRQGNLTLFDLYTADEIFLTGTGAEIVPVISLDGRKVGNGRPGPVTHKLLKAFRAYTTTGAED